MPDSELSREIENNQNSKKLKKHNLTHADELSNRNYGLIGLLSVTTGQLLPNIKRKNPSEEPGQFLPDSELSRKIEKNQNSKKLKKHNLTHAAERSNRNYGSIGLLSVTTGQLPPNLKQKNTSEAPGHFLSDSELSRNIEKNQNSKKLKKHNLS